MGCRFSLDSTHTPLRKSGKKKKSTKYRNVVSVKTNNRFFDDNVTVQYGGGKDSVTIKVVLAEELNLEEEYVNKYYKGLLKNGYTSVNDLRGITPAELAECGVKMGHAKRIAKYLEERVDYDDGPPGYIEERLSYKDKEDSSFTIQEIECREKAPEPDLDNYIVLTLGNCEFCPTFMNEDGNIPVNLKALRPDPTGYKKNAPCEYDVMTPKDDCDDRDDVDVYSEHDDNLDLDIIKEKVKPLERDTRPIMKVLMNELNISDNLAAKYSKNLGKNGFETIEDLYGMLPAELVDCGIKKGHARRIFKYIEEENLKYMENAFLIQRQNSIISKMSKRSKAEKQRFCEREELRSDPNHIADRDDSMSTRSTRSTRSRTDRESTKSQAESDDTRNSRVEKEEHNRYKFTKESNDDMETNLNATKLHILDTLEITATLCQMCCQAIDLKPLKIYIPKKFDKKKIKSINSTRSTKSTKSSRSIKSTKSKSNGIPT